MSSEAQTKQPNERLKIAVVSAKEQAIRIQGAIARRAFLGRETCIAGDDLQKWRRAKSELVKTLHCGLAIRDEDIRVRADAEEFKESTVEIWVSPRHVTICSEPYGSQEKDRMVFCALDLPVEVEPTVVNAEVKGPELEIYLSKAHKV